MTSARGWPVWLRLAVAAILGALGAFGLAPFGYWPATLAALVLIAPSFQVCDTRAQAAWLGWAFATGYFAHALSWIVEPFLVDVQRHGWMAPFALIFMAGGLALFWAAAFWIARRRDVSAVPQAVFLALSLSLAEIARGYLLTGFPWAGVAQIWVNTPVAQLLSLIGPYGLGALTFVVTLPLGAAVFHTKSLRGSAWPLACMIGFGVFAFAFSASRSPISEGDKTVRLVQPNAPQHQKWDPDYMPLFFARQIEFTAAAPKMDLIVWPETSVPAWLDSAQPYLQSISEAARGTPVIVGIQRADGPRIYNSMLLLDDVGASKGLYDKHHLAPFGEYVPFSDLLARLGIFGLATTVGRGFSAGPGPAVMDVGPLGKALPLICYEVVFPQDVNGAPARADFLLQITNDAWFGTWSGPYQHLAQAQMRAIEQGLPMMRAANTGVSAMIDPHGRVTASLPLGQAGFVDATLPLPLAPTLYVRIGDVAIILVVSVAFVLLWGWMRRTDNF